MQKLHEQRFAHDCMGTTPFLLIASCVVSVCHAPHAHLYMSPYSESFCNMYCTKLKLSLPRSGHLLDNFQYPYWKGQASPIQHCSDHCRLHSLRQKLSASNTGNHNQTPGLFLAFCLHHTSPPALWTTRTPRPAHNRHSTANSGLPWERTSQEENELAAWHPQCWTRRIHLQCEVPHLQVSPHQCEDQAQCRNWSPKLLREAVRLAVFRDLEFWHKMQLTCLSMWRSGNWRIKNLDDMLRGYSLATQVFGVCHASSKWGSMTARATIKLRSQNHWQCTVHEHGIMVWLYLFRFGSQFTSCKTKTLWNLKAWQAELIQRLHLETILAQFPPNFRLEFSFDTAENPCCTWSNTMRLSSSQMLLNPTRRIRSDCWHRLANQLSW